MIRKIALGACLLACPLLAQSGPILSVELLDTAPSDGTTGSASKGGGTGGSKAGGGGGSQTHYPLTTPVSLVIRQVPDPTVAPGDTLSLTCFGDNSGTVTAIRAAIAAGDLVGARVHFYYPVTGTDFPLDLNGVTAIHSRLLDGDDDWDAMDDLPQDKITLTFTSLQMAGVGGGAAD